LSTSTKGPREVFSVRLTVWSSVEELVSQINKKLGGKSFLRFGFNCVSIKTDVLTPVSLDSFVYFLPHTTATSPLLFDELDDPTVAIPSDVWVKCVVGGVPFSVSGVTDKNTCEFLVSEILAHQHRTGGRERYGAPARAVATVEDGVLKEAHPAEQIESISGFVGNSYEQPILFYGEDLPTPSNPALVPITEERVRGMIDVKAEELIRMRVSRTSTNSSERERRVPLPEDVAEAALDHLNNH